MDNDNFISNNEIDDSGQPNVETWIPVEIVDSSTQEAVSPDEPSPGPESPAAPAVTTHQPTSEAGDTAQTASPGGGATVDTTTTATASTSAAADDSTVGSTEGQEGTAADTGQGDDGATVIEAADGGEDGKEDGEEDGGEEEGGEEFVPLHNMTYREACGRQPWLDPIFKKKYLRNNPRMARMMKTGWVTYLCASGPVYMPLRVACPSCLVGMGREDFQVL